MSDGTQDKFEGKTKETVGKLTGDERLESEGKTQHAGGKLSDAVHDAGDKLKGAADAVKGRLGGGHTDKH